MLALVNAQPHRNAHPKDLRSLKTNIFMVNQVTIIESLQPEVGKFKVALKLESLGELLEIKLKQLRLHVLSLHSLLKALFKILLVRLIKGLAIGSYRHRLTVNNIKEQACCYA